ncbi:50S ribosomal protein L25/general stress protein Ctc [Sulfurimonas sp. MAG313]|nr:50S ribosomal protein L25/general stress protein Ctc [Sulfurimonas sp. MAG313]MDF1880327.1 50S ribosomal protein L25/general stress protein Ctc [Sulfurimonas sp. MAG313]
MLEGIIRESIGKKGTKALRRDGYLIANIYGKGLDNVCAAFKSNDYIRTVKNKDTVNFDVKVDGKAHNVVVQAYQVHPLTGSLVHVDLMIAQPGVVAKYLVPVVTVGEPIGLKNKGLLSVAKKRLALKAKVEDLPINITLDVEPLDIGNSILIRDIKAPANTKFLDADRVAVISIIKAK